MTEMCKDLDSIPSTREKVGEKIYGFSLALLDTRHLLDRSEELWAHNYSLPCRKLLYSGVLKVSETLLNASYIYSEWKLPKPAQLVSVLDCVGWI